MTSLQKIADGLWVASAPCKFILFHLGTRMTVVQLSSGGLLLHSPIPLNESLKLDLQSLGTVTHIVCPNNFHHLYAGQAIASYPHAILHGPATLHKKRKDLSFGATLSDSLHSDWDPDLVPLTIHGSMMEETVFYHPASKTLITSDIVENFQTSSHWPTRFWLQLGGLHGQVSWHRLLRSVYRDKKIARDCIDQMLEFPFEQVILAHGDIITENARETLRKGLSWL